MPWKYSQSTGDLIGPAGSRVCIGYSGHGAGVDNPADEAIPDVGPIPRGEYTIGRFFDDPVKGPIVAHLVPLAGTDTYGRSGFMIHGDNKAGNHTASEGCVILPRTVREMIMASPDRVLQVIR